MTRPTTVSKTNRRLWEQLAATRNLPVKTVKKWFETQRTRYGKLTRTKSGQAAEKSTERQTWLKDSFSFLRGHIRQKGVSKSSAFKSPQRPSAAAASVPDTLRDTESEMEISIASDVTHQLSSTNPKQRQPPVATTTTAADPVSDQFQQMRSMISTFLGAHQDVTPSPRQLFCNYLHSEIEHLEERDFLTFRNETVKLLSEIQYKAKERNRQVTTSHQVTTFQCPEATQATAGCEYILTIPETQAVSIPVVQPSQIATTQLATVIAKLQHPSRPSSVSAQPTSYVVVDDQQPGTSRQMNFNPPSVAASHQEESQHNTSGLSSLFGAIPSVLQYQQINTPQPFSPSQLQPAPSPVQSSTHQEQSRPPSHSSQQSQPKSAD